MKDYGKSLKNIEYPDRSSLEELSEIYLKKNPPGGRRAERERRLPNGK